MNMNISRSGSKIRQDVRVDQENSSTTNLTSSNSYTFIGVGASTLGVVGLQWNLKTDQNATVYIEQSDDNTNWDISDSFDYRIGYSSGGNTVQAISSYWRIRVVLIGTIDTTYFRLLGILCPMAEPLPRALSSDERLMTEAKLTGQLDRNVWVSPIKALSTYIKNRLVGTNFDGTTKDTSFWSETVTGSGAAVQNGEITLSTGATANSTALYETVQKARFAVGNDLLFTGAFKFKSVANADNIRRCGAYDDDNGFFFELDNETFSIGTRKSTSDTLISSGSFNGEYGTKFTPTTETVYYKLDIEYTPIGAFWYVNDILLHSQFGVGHLTNFLTLPVRFEIINDNDNTTENTFDCIASVISRLGPLETSPIYKYIAGAATTVLKVGAGVLHSIINNDNSGSITIYDNTAGSGTIIASIDLSKVLGTLIFDIPFNDGLTLVTVGAGTKITATYE